MPGNSDRQPFPSAVKRTGPGGNPLHTRVANKNKGLPKPAKAPTDIDYSGRSMGKTGPKRGSSY